MDPMDDYYPHMQNGVFDVPSTTTQPPYFIKERTSDFVWHIAQLSHMKRGKFDMLSWFARVTILLDKARDAWMNLCVPASSHRIVARHRANFPFSENMFALMVIVLVDLTQSRRERFMSILLIKSIPLQELTFEIV